MGKGSISIAVDRARLATTLGLGDVASTSLPTPDAIEKVSIGPCTTVRAMAWIANWYRKDRED